MNFAHQTFSKNSLKELRVISDLAPYVEPTTT